MKTPGKSAKQAVRLLTAIAGASALLFALEGAQSPGMQKKRPAKAAAAVSEKESAMEAIRLNNLGAGYMAQQRLAEALKLFQRARALDRRLFTARLNEGIALLNLQRIEPAREILLEVARQQPQNPRAWYNLGLLYKNAGDAPKALDAFQTVVELTPDDADTRYFLGLLYAQVEQFEPAIAAFRAALERNPFHVSAEFGLARAYQRTGDEAKAREHLTRFQHLTQEKLGAPMSLAYGDQGPLSLAEAVYSAGNIVPPAIRVRFVAVPAGQSGLVMGHRAERTISQACVADYNNDGKPDIFVISSGDSGGAKLFRNEGQRFTDVTQEAGLANLKAGTACVAGDYDNDGRVDLAIGDASGIRLFHNDGGGKFREVSTESGLKGPADASHLLFFDFDHDGDLDLLVSTGSSHASKSQILWRNNGNGTFTDWTEEAGLNARAPSTRVLASDLNNDRAIDVFVPSYAGSATIFFNPREGKFTAATPWSNKEAANGASDATVLDFDHDGWMDIATVELQHGITLWRNDHGRAFTALPFPNPAGFWPFRVVALDFDNDGWVDLAESGCSAQNCGVRVFRNEGGGKFADVSAAAGADKVWNGGEAPRLDLETLDYDGDGDTDLLLALPDGSITLLRNDGGNRNNSLRVSFKGLADNRNAMGTKVEVFAGASYQKFEVSTPNDLLVGLGKGKQADVVRLLWPTGVVQDEVNLPAARRHQIAEIDRRGSSCPLLFAWNGSRYEFIADMIGPGIVGHWVGPGERNVPDPTEYLKVNGQSARPRDGRLSFRFVEPMEEAVYLDQARLLAVDHPSDVSVYPNEYFASAPPFPEFKVIASRAARPPRGAWDDNGRSVLAELQGNDRRYVTGFRPAPFKGFAELHSLELDLGDWSGRRGGLCLLMRGFTDYFTATSVYAAHQAGVYPVAPYVEALDAGGRWVRVVDDMGFPAGLARTMVADLSGKLPAGTRRIRISTNLMIYWDQILIDTTPENPPYHLAEVPLSAASLDFLGYPRELHGSPRADLTYSYEQVSHTGPYARHAGNYTRYGDVRALLGSVDDRYVLFGSGDELRIDFDAGALPALPPGWKRDYFFFADGFTKDMDAHAAYGGTVEPLPYHQMTSYPYGDDASYLLDDAHLDFRLHTLTRSVSNQPAVSYRFAYPPANHHKK